jgi:hypothetical protein
MNRRNAFIIAGIAVFGLAVLALGAVLATQWINRQRERQIEAIRHASGEFGKAISDAMASADMNGPDLDWRVKLDGDETIVTFTVSNRKPTAYKDVVLEGFVLGKKAPRENATLPMKIAELAPGASHSFDLHYDGLVWIGDEVTVDRIDTGWAAKLLDFSKKWVSVADPKPQSTRPGVTTKLSDYSGSSANTGVRVELDEKDARAIKARRDAAWKAKDGKNDSK